MLRTLMSTLVVTTFLGLQPRPAIAQTTTPARPAAKPAVTAAVNLNTASATDLEGLPGIGAKTAARIVDYRQKNGSISEQPTPFNEVSSQNGPLDHEFIMISVRYSSVPHPTAMRCVLR